VAVAVTRRSIRAVPIAIGTWYPPAGGPESCHGGVVFAVMVQILLRADAIAVQVRLEPRPDSYRDYPRLRSWWRALAQCRDTNYLEGRNLS
jgi:hypothetical protein